MKALSQEGSSVSKKPVPFRHKDVVRCIKAVESAGIAIGRLEVDPRSGRIIVTPAVGTTGNVNQSAGSELDNWVAKRDARPA
jgi:hypothetical protein